MCNFRPFNAHIQIFSYVFLNFPQQILHLPKFTQGNWRAVRLTPGCPVITMRSPYLIRYEVFNVITMWIPYLIRYEVLYVIARHRQRRCRGNLPEGYPLFVFPCRANIYCFLHNCQYDTLAKYMTDCDIFFGIILIIKLKTENASQKYNLIFWFITR